MKLLCIDTATFFESIALVDGDIIVAEHRIERHRGHGPGILDDIDGLLNESDWQLSDIDGFVAGLGPGSFTGLRICLATLKGFALALNKPIYGARTTHLVRAAVGDNAVAILDARRGQVYVEGGPVNEPVCCDPQHVAALLGDGAYRLVGDGAAMYQDIFSEMIPSASVVEEPTLHHPRAALLAQLIDLKVPAPLSTLEPVYVRKSDAEINYPDGFPDVALRPPGSK